MCVTEEPGVQGVILSKVTTWSKVSRDSVAEVCVQALEQPKACNVTFGERGEGEESNNCRVYSSAYNLTSNL